MSRIEVIIIGDEILNGTIVDSNSAWLGQEAQRLGLVIQARQTVPDTIEQVVAAMELASRRADLVITSGGLGPTVDDLTAEASAVFLGDELRLHSDALDQIKARREAAGRQLKELDKKQALLPDSATVLENQVGTAPAFSVQRPGGAQFFHLPGVPREWRRLCQDYVLPELERRAGKTTVSRTWKFFGVTESELAVQVNALEPEELSLHYRAHFPEIHLTVQTLDSRSLARFEERLMSAVGSRYFGGPETTFPQAVVSGLSERGWTVATAESCTGGMVAQFITSVAGSSAVFETGLVTYANAAKTALVGVSEALLKAHGAVSEEVVCAMAEGVRTRYGATLGVATSGIAGPGGGTPDKPVGTIHVALSSAERVTHRQFKFPFERDRNRKLTAYAALDLIRRTCQKSPAPSRL